jgi:hypothetical protein
MAKTTSDTPAPKPSRTGKTNTANSGKWTQRDATAGDVLDGVGSVGSYWKAVFGK